MINLIKFGLLNSNNDFCSINSNSLGVMLFYKDKDHPEKSIEHKFIEEGIIMIYRENLRLMKTGKNCN